MKRDVLGGICAKMCGLLSEVLTGVSKITKHVKFEVLPKNDYSIEVTQQLRIVNLTELAKTAVRETFRRGLIGGFMKEGLVATTSM